MAAAAKPSRPLIPVLVGLLFLGPLLLATLLYSLGGDYWRPTGSSAHGALIQSPRALPDGPVLVRGGHPVAFAGKWSLIYIGSGDCGPDCREALYRTRQVRRALGKEMSRVQRFYVVTTGAPDDDFLRAEHPDIGLLGEHSMSRSAALAAVGEYEQGQIFVADPLGNVIMRFTPGTPMKDLHADLALLLKASQIG